MQTRSLDRLSAITANIGWNAQGAESSLKKRVKLLEQALAQQGGLPSADRGAVVEGDDAATDSPVYADELSAEAAYDALPAAKGEASDIGMPTY